LKIRDINNQNNGIMNALKKYNYILIFTLFVLILCGCSDDSPEKEPEKEPEYEFVDQLGVIDMIYSVADELDMKVISDVDLTGGNLYPSGNVDELIKKCNIYTTYYYEKYGNHSSFWGWYLNNEINPIENSDHTQSAFWRAIWKAVVSKCHELAPGSKVTISPFILLDKEGHRGFKYLEPSEYEEWWYNTLKETGIDIIMLQDSGAEHLSFFTLEEREPFFAAFASACSRAGKELWLNVESAQVEAENWEHALQMEREGNRAWKFTPIEWLGQKLDLAAKYGTQIVNWGYFPMMNPLQTPSGMTVEDIDGQIVDLSGRKANYNAYKTYMENIPDIIPEGRLTSPKINGTLWYLAGNAYGLGGQALKDAIRLDIEKQKEAGFELLWLVNTPAHFRNIKATP